jgi:hypothetical protein
MLTTVDFNDQFLLSAYKINDESIDRFLAHKFETAESPVPQG